MNIDNLTIGEAKELASIFSAGKTKSTIHNRHVGKYVIVRSRNEGINFGEIVECDETGIVLKGAIRLWSHAPRSRSMSWYEGVALSGLSADSNISPAVDEKVIIEEYSITVCSSDAIKSITEHKPHEQS